MARSSLDAQRALEQERTKAAVPLPAQGGWAGARGWERHSSRGSSGGGSIASSPGDSISRLKFSSCPWYRARLRHGQNVSLLARSLPGSSIQEREQTQRVRSPHLPNSQRRPKNPGGHWQMVTFPSRQLPPLRHSQPSESSAREETGASQDPSGLRGWDSHTALLDATHGGSSGGQQPQAPSQTPRHSLFQQDRPTVHSRSPEWTLRGCCFSLSGAQET